MSVAEKKPSEMTLQELRDYIQEHVPYFMGLKIYISRKKTANGKDYEWVDVYVSRNRRTTIHGWADMLYNNENPVDRAIKMIIERSKKECGSRE